MCKKPGFPPDQDKKLDLSYSTTTTSTQGCFCTGQCDVFGYCPNEKPSQKETAHQKARRLGVKVFEYNPEPFHPQKPNPVIGVCGKCEREIVLHNTTNPCFETDCPAGISCVMPC